jgi:phosphoribosyl-ATP pyrophosphohydrolase
LIILLDSPHLQGAIDLMFEANVLARLMAIIEDRKANPPERSYTTSLFQGGVAKIGGKIVEEAAEVVEAAREPGDDGRSHLISEAGDLIYHLLVMLGHKNIKLSEVEAELAKRFGVSGLDEKAARSEQANTEKGSAE